MDNSFETEAIWTWKSATSSEKDTAVFGHLDERQTRHPATVKRLHGVGSKEIRNDMLHFRTYPQFYTVKDRASIETDFAGTDLHRLQRIPSVQPLCHAGQLVRGIPAAPQILYTVHVLCNVWVISTIH